MDSIKNRYLDDHLGNFIDALAIAQDESAIRFALQHLARNAGFDHFSAMSHYFSEAYGGAPRIVSCGHLGYSFPLSHGFEPMDVNGRC